MRLLELERRLDEMFDFGAYPEPDGWAFALPSEAADELRSFGSPTFRATFNGAILPAPGRDVEIQRAHLLVFPEASLVDQVIAHEQANPTRGAVIVTHHPVDMETSRRGFLPIPSDQLARLRELQIGVIVLHAPLDCHPEISTSSALCEALGLRRLRTFAPYTAGDCGVVAEAPGETFSRFAERVRVACELPSFLGEALRFSGRAVHRVAIVAGGGDDVDYLRQANKLGADTYLAGHWWTPHDGAWCEDNRAAIRRALPKIDMNLISASHDGSELVVFRDRLLPMFESMGFQSTLWRQDDHWR